MNQAEKIYDVIIIGGGPAGMMAAGTAASRGLRVLLLEKNPDVGKKLLITGGGRCNVTNAETDLRTLLSHYKDSRDFLFSAFTQYGVTEMLTFLHKQAVATKVEDNQRVFPVSDKAHSVWLALKKYMEMGCVDIQNNTAVFSIDHDLNAITGITLQSKKILKAHSYILATGGKSRPETGSTGDGFTWLKALGHTIIEPDASLVPVSLQEKWLPRVAGVSLPNVKISLYQDGKKQYSKLGKILFTHVGVSGPTILNLSKNVRELLSYGKVDLCLDLFPTLNQAELDSQLVTLFHSNSNKQFKNILSPLLPSALVKIVVELSNINPSTPSHSISKEERKGLVKLLKQFTLSVKGLLGTDKAIVTSGGVVLPEVNFKTMASRKFSNLYIVGDLLNIDRPSGGYSLQLCWTTGYVAGKSVPTEK